jgi:hypothetical protein
VEVEVAVPRLTPAWFEGAKDGRDRVTGTVYRLPGTKGPWLARVDGTDIAIMVGGRDIAVREAIRQASLPLDQRTPATVSVHL